jgi:hypothetical protein
MRFEPRADHVLGVEVQTSLLELYLYIKACA